MNDRPAIFCCGRVADRERVWVAGSEIDTCSKCGAQVYVAPSSRAIAARRRSNTILCVECFVEYLGERKAAGRRPLDIMPNNAEQLAELEATRKREP